MAHGLELTVSVKLRVIPKGLVGLLFATSLVCLGRVWTGGRRRKRQILLWTHCFFTSLTHTAESHHFKVHYHNIKKGKNVKKMYLNLKVITNMLNCLAFKNINNEDTDFFCACEANRSSPWNRQQWWIAMLLLKGKGSSQYSHCSQWKNMGAKAVSFCRRVEDARGRLAGTASFTNWLLLRLFQFNVNH